MAYEETTVLVQKSQQQIRNMVMSHHGTGLMLISQPPREGFEAFVTIDETPYHIRIMATCTKIIGHDRAGRTRSQKVMQSLIEAEERRVWRVLYWHLKALFEAADSGVIDIRNVIMPYIVLNDGRTLSEHVIPRLPELMEMRTTDKLLLA